MTCQKTNVVWCSDQLLASIYVPRIESIFKNKAYILLQEELITHCRLLGSYEACLNDKPLQMYCQGTQLIISRLMTISHVRQDCLKVCGTLTYLLVLEPASLIDLTTHGCNPTSPKDQGSYATSRFFTSLREVSHPAKRACVLSSLPLPNKYEEISGCCLRPVWLTSDGLNFGSVLYPRVKVVTSSQLRQMPKPLFYESTFQYNFFVYLGIFTQSHRC